MSGSRHIYLYFFKLNYRLASKHVQMAFQSQLQDTLGKNLLVCLFVSTVGQVTGMVHQVSRLMCFLLQTLLNASNKSLISMNGIRCNKLSVNKAWDFYLATCDDQINQLWVILFLWGLTTHHHVEYVWARFFSPSGLLFNVTCLDVCMYVHQVTHIAFK